MEACGKGARDARWAAGRFLLFLLLHPDLLPARGADSCKAESFEEGNGSLGRATGDESGKVGGRDCHRGKRVKKQGAWLRILGKTATNSLQKSGEELATGER